MLADLLGFLRDRALSRGLSPQGASAGRIAGDLARLEVTARNNPTAYNWNELGIALGAHSGPNAALEAFRQAVDCDPMFAAAHVNLGDMLAALKRFEAALQSYDRAIAIRPDWAGTHVCCGNALAESGRMAAAIESYERALAVDPEYVGGHYNLGLALREVGRPADALASLSRAMALDPDLEFLRGMWLLCRLAVCDWDGIGPEFDILFASIARGESATPPFALVAMPAPAHVQKRAAEVWTQARFPADDRLGALPRRAPGSKIRIGYFSADFHDHATARLAVELFERHDRRRFELTAFSFGPPSEDAMRHRLAGAFDRWVDARLLPDAEVAMQARTLGIDIAVDLKGFSQDSRTGIFALRAAPIQVNYLVYPGTMGAPYIDYLVVDGVLVPEGHSDAYAEKIVRLPDCYQPNDSRRPISDRLFTREEAGLPRHGFVFCCFNNNYKIGPEVFDGWMRILKQVEDSVLWLLEDNPRAVESLRKEARVRGIPPGRLVFAPRLGLPEHLARHRLADLFLDTLPCNAHTTASDALWAGLPVLTIVGDTFAGRVAASLLHAVALDELVAPDLSHYEALAVALARDRPRLGALRQALAASRSTAPLFDSPRYARHLEKAFEAMCERYQAGLPPAPIDVAKMPGG